MSAHDVLLRDLDLDMELDLSSSREIFSQSNTGSFAKPLKRSSRSPSYSRQYLNGDPINMIDWKAYARTDQLIVREDREESSPKVCILLDARSTLHWPEERTTVEKVSTKWEIALRIYFHIATLHIKLGDRVSLYLCNGNEEVRRVFYSGLQDIRSIYEDLNDNNFSEEILSSHLEFADIDLSQMNLTYLISDCLSSNSLTESHDETVRLIHVLSSMEVNIDWMNDSKCYFDYATNKLEFLGKNLKKSQNYQPKLESWLLSIRKEYDDRYILVTDKTPIDLYLNFLSEI